MNSKYLQQGEPLYVETAKMMGGDFSSYQQFYNLSVQYLYGVINGIISDETVSQNLTNDLYNDIYSTIYQLQDPAVFLIWSGNMATNKAFSYICANKPQLVDEASDFSGMQNGGTQAAAEEYVSEFAYQDQEPFIPEDFMQQQAVRDIVNERIASLPVLTRCIMQKYYYHDLPVDRIAYELNISSHRVVQELSRVKRMMKDVIAASYGQDYKNRVRIYSLAEVSIVWVVFANIVGRISSGAAAVGIAAGGAAVGGAASSAVMTGAGAAVGVGTSAGAVSGASAGAGIGGFAGAAGTSAVGGGMSGGISAGAGGFAGAAGTSAVGGGMSGGISAGVGGFAGTSSVGVTTAGATTAGATTAGATTAGTTAAGAATAGTSAATATGLGLGAKIGIAAAATAIAAGGAAGIYTAVNNYVESGAKSAIYAEKNDLPFSDEIDGYTSPGYVTFTDGAGTEIQIEDVKIVPNDSETSITDYSETVTEDGYRILSFTTQTVQPVEIYDPNGNAGSLSASVASFELFDYYTGMTLPTRYTYGSEKIGGEIEVENGDESYEISYTKSTSWNWSSWDFMGDGHNIRYATMYCYFEVTMPEDYDGLCLWYDKSGIDHRLSGDDFDEKESQEVLELCDADDIICYRMENLAEDEN